MNNFQSALNKKDPIRADLIDYRDTGRKGHPYLEIDFYPTLEKAVEDFTSTGWEEDGDVLMQNCYFMSNDETGQILAVGMYVKTDKSEMPALMWVFTETGTTSIHYYEIEYSEFIKKYRLIANREQLSADRQTPAAQGGTDD